MTDDLPAGPPPVRVPRAVPPGRALAWFGEAIRLWKRAPFTFSAMAVAVLVASVALQPVPVAGLVAANVLAPLLACGLIYGSLAADRGDQPRISHLVAVFVAPLPAQGAIIAASLVVTLAESLVAWAMSGVNLLLPVSEAATLSPSAIVAIYAVGVLASLPVTFVPMAVLFDGARAGDAFASSWRACALNPRSMLGLAAYSYALLMVGLATTGIGLVLALPWIAAASYAAWKDIFGLTATRHGSLA